MILSVLIVSCYKSEDVADVEIIEPSEFTQKLLLEDYTGTWCVYCPKAGQAIEHAVEDNDRFVPVAIHFFSNSNPEEMQNEFTESIVSRYHPDGGFPKVNLNRSESLWPNDYLVSTLEAMLNRYAPVGLAINSTLTGNSIDLEIKVGFVEETTTVNNYKLVVYLLEDGLIYPQDNASLLDLPNPIEDYEHNDVLRYSFTNVFGDDLPNMVADNHRFVTNFNSISLPDYIEDISNLKIVAFIVDNNDNCLNVQVANVGENKDFD